MNSLHITEWAAALTVRPLACRRVIPVEIRGRVLEQSAVGAVLATLDALSCFAASAYFCPRVEPDGGRACLRRCDKDHLEVQAERILLAAHKLCLRADCDAVGGVPPFNQALYHTGQSA